MYAATIPTYRHEPKLHVHYGESVLSIKDGLPKMKDVPKEMGGSGVMLPNSLPCAGCVGSRKSVWRRHYLDATESMTAPLRRRPGVNRVASTWRYNSHRYLANLPGSGTQTVT